MSEMPKLLLRERGCKVRKILGTGSSSDRYLQLDDGAIFDTKLKPTAWLTSERKGSFLVELLEGCFAVVSADHAEKLFKEVDPNFDLDELAGQITDTQYFTVGQLTMCVISLGPNRQFLGRYHHLPHEESIDDKMRRVIAERNALDQIVAHHIARTCEQLELVQ